MNPLTRLQDALRQQAQPAIMSRPNETGLRLLKLDFAVKMLREPRGKELLDTLQNGEHRICKRLGLISGYMDGDVAYFDVPSWNALVAHLTAVHLVDQMEE